MSPMIAHDLPTRINLDRLKISIEDESYHYTKEVRGTREGWLPVLDVWYQKWCLDVAKCMLVRTVPAMSNEPTIEMTHQNQ